MKKKFNIIRYIFFSVAFGFLMSCQGKPFSETEIHGSYKLDAEHYSGTLELRSDGIYVQDLYFKSGPPQKKEGKWTYSPPSSGDVNRGTVRIFGAFSETNGSAKQDEPDRSIPMSVYVSPKRVTLFLTPDGNESYSKNR